MMMVWCICVQWVIPIHKAVGHIEIFWSRLPIFFLGINCGEWVRTEKKMENGAWGLLILTFLATASACIYLEQVRHGRFPLFAERMIYIPLTISLLFESWDSFPGYYQSGALPHPSSFRDGVYHTLSSGLLANGIVDLVVCYSPVVVVTLPD